MTYTSKFYNEALARNIAKVLGGTTATEKDEIGITRYVVTTPVKEGKDNAD